MLNQCLYKGILAFSLLSLSTEPLLAQNRIVQQSSSRATATGENSVAASQVEQYATQQGSNPQQQLTIEQYGSSNAVADGDNNVVVTDINQESHQQESNYSTGDRQTNIQKATINGRARGRNNRVFNNIRQYNLQNH